MHQSVGLLDPPEASTTQAKAPGRPAGLSSSIPRSSRHRWLAAATIAVLGVLLAGVQVDRFRLHRQEARLGQQKAQAKAGLGSTREEVEAARAEQASAGSRTEAARGDLERAKALLAEAGLTRGTLGATERETTRFLSGLESMHSSTQGQVDRLATGVLEPSAA